MNEFESRLAADVLMEESLKAAFEAGRESPKHLTTEEAYEEWRESNKRGELLRFPTRPDDDLPPGAA